MDFTLSKQQQMVQKMYKEFAENEVKPRAKQVDAEMCIRDRKLADKAGCAFCPDMEALLALHPDIVVETAGIPAVRAYAAAILESGADLAVISIGAFADAEFQARIKETAARCGRKVYLASGAVGGFDVLSTITLMARAEGKEPAVSFHTHKSPGSLRETPVYRPEMEGAEMRCV